MEDGTTPLYIACENGHVDAARLLLEKGAEVESGDGVRCDAAVHRLRGRATSKRRGCCWTKGAEVNQAKKTYGATPLHVACQGHVDAARLLLDKGAEVDRAMEDAPLWIACRHGHVDVARLLLDNGAEVDRAEGGRRTPLYVACQQGHVDAVRLLLEKGAAVDRADTQGRTPLDAAKKCRHDAVVALIEDHRYKADIDATRRWRPSGAAKIWRA